MTTDYEIEVMQAGNAKPWNGKPRLSHADKFSWADMRTDGVGNVLEQPPLRKKWCFGRPETFFRHGGRTRQVSLAGGRTVQSCTHQCGRCPEGIWDACAKLSWERINSDSSVAAAFHRWHAYSMKVYGRLVYTGPAGELWVAFKKAYAAVGPFLTVNDEVLAADLAAAEVRKKEKEEAKRGAWRESKRRSRAKDRKSRASDHLPPSDEFMRNALAERDRRSDQLAAVAGLASMPPCIARIPKGQEIRTAAITANAWFVDTVRSAMGYDRRPGTIAREMVDRCLNEGLAYPSLKARMQKDLERVGVLEETGVWGRFDPDADLEKKSRELDDLDSVVASIDDYLDAMDAELASN